MKILRVIIIVILVLMAVPREVWAKDYGYIYFYNNNCSYYVKKKKKV